MEKIVFLSPDPATAVATGSFMAIDVKLSADDGGIVANKNLSWNTFSEDNSPFTDTTQTEPDGTSSNEIEIQSASDAGYLAVSVWDADVESSGHFVALYKNTTVNSVFSLNHAGARTSANTSLTDSSTYVSATAILTDDQNSPVANFPVAWTGTVNLPRSAFLPDGTKLVPEDLAYVTTTDDDGRTTVEFKNPGTTLINLAVGPKGLAVTSRGVAFSTQSGSGGVKNPLLPPTAVPDPLALDAVPGGQVPINIPVTAWVGDSAGYSYAVFINGVVGAFGVVDEKPPQAVYVPKSLFKSGASNVVGYVICTDSGNGQESTPQSLMAVGAAQTYQPSTTVTRQFLAPATQGFALINTSAISGGLVIQVPPGSGDRQNPDTFALEENDLVTVNVYLNGYFSSAAGSSPRSNLLTSAQHTVLSDEARSGFWVLFDESDLTGYAQGADRSASFKAEYIVSRAQSSWGEMYSKILQLKLDT